MTLQLPSFLQRGDLVRIVATAKYIDKTPIDYAVSYLESLGLRVEVGENVLNKFHRFAGTDNERLNDLQSALNDDQVKAIICARGGYGSMRIVDAVDWTKFCENPKWICGFSDVNALLLRANSLGICSMHSTMPINYEINTEEALDTLQANLFGEQRSIVWKTSSFKHIETEAPCYCANLSMLHSMLGSTDMPNLNGAILILEDLDEYLYHTERMLLSFRKAGVFDKLKVLIVGGMTDMKDNDEAFGLDVNEIFSYVCNDFDFPIIFDAPIGHFADNRAIINGNKYCLKISEGNAELSPIFQRKL